MFGPFLTSQKPVSLISGGEQDPLPDPLKNMPSEAFFVLQYQGGNSDDLEHS